MFVGIRLCILEKNDKLYIIIFFWKSAGMNFRNIYEFRIQVNFMKTSIQLMEVRECLDRLSGKRRDIVSCELKL